MAKLIAAGVLGNKSGRGFFQREGKTRLVLDPTRRATTARVEEIPLPALGYIDGDRGPASRSGATPRGWRVFLTAPGDEADLARKVIAGYISYAFHRVGEVTDSITGDRPHHGRRLQLGAAERAGRRDRQAETVA
jgi:hypothetical protein